ncbi:hypothetical protein Dimus_039542 [Dionaea muscipula]
MDLGYLVLRGFSVRMPWWKLCWSAAVHQWWGFILWLAMFDRLRIKTRLGSMGFRDETICVLCENVDEDRDHLFFLCPFVQEVRKRVLHCLGLRSTASCWMAWWQWLLKICKGRTVIARQRQCIAAAFVYEIWRERNDRIFKAKARAVPSVVEGVLCLLGCPLISAS